MAESADSGVHRINRKRILVVDDDQDAAELFAIWLRREGYLTSIAGDAARAAILAPLVRPDVALVDIGLPVIDGIELVRILRELPELHSCRFIAVTAYANPLLPAECFDAGFSDFLQKPLDRSTLLASVRAPLVHGRAQYR